MSPNHTQMAQGSLPALNLAASELAQAGQPAVILCTDAGQARQLVGELRFLLDADAVRLFPDWETLPYDRLPVDGNLTDSRLRTLNDLQNGWQGLLLVTPASLLQRLPPASWLTGNGLHIRCGEELPAHTLRERLVVAGYRRADQVEAPGEFALRGAVLDFFPTGHTRPLRLEFDCDRVETMRWFDPTTQLGTSQCTQMECFAGREFTLDQDSIASFCTHFRTRFDRDETRCTLFNEVVAGQAADGAEYFLDLFFEQTALLTDYLPDRDALPLLLMPGARAKLGELAQSASERYELLRHDPAWPLLEPGRIFADLKELQAAGLVPTPMQKLPGGTGWKQLRGGTFDAARLKSWLSRHKQARILLCAPSHGRLAETRQQLDLEQHPPVHMDWQSFVTGSNRFGLALAPLRGIAVHPERDLLLIGSGDGHHESTSSATADRADEPLGQAPAHPLMNLRPGQLVVHEQHGLGRYLGLKTMTVGGREQEFASLEYRNGALLHLPVGELRLITPYRHASEAEITLDRLGSEKFSRARQKAQQKARDDAAELLALYARRNAKGCVRLKVSDEDLNEFCRQFPFQQTPDQRRLTTLIRDKLDSERPDVLLICGDVGFGKTELAMRAAFIATRAGKQCCLLAPTTLLCQQHYQRFRERFAGWGIQVDKLDSGLSTSGRKRLQAQLQSGQLHLLVSTHAVLRGSWKIPDLGLVVVDEEHRFGVSDKERIHSLRSGAQSISMTATPIPRTLHRSLSGLNEIAIMNEPPPGRVPVQTFIRPWDDELVREALRREKIRGGQTFIVHDRISGLDDMAEQIGGLLPDLRLATAHGRMSARQLQDAMEAYNSGEIDVLLSTTVIESGIDVPNANTLLVTRADRMGLAQLHQLRGRVGRADRMAWCWFLYPNQAQLAHEALQRLRAVESATGPGAGLLLAREDLELRGAGELLGREQSGHMQRVGLDMYLSMLNRAIEDIRHGRSPDADPVEDSCEVNLDDVALIPQAWIADPWIRVQYYHRLSSATEPTEVDALSSELRDRFGPLPLEVERLLRNTALRIRAQNLGARGLTVSGDECALQIRDGTLEPQTAIELVRSHPDRLRLTPSAIRMHISGGAEQSARWLLDQLDDMREASRELA